MFRSELGLKSNEIEKIQMIFKNHSEIEKVIIYGSRAKGNYKPYSDIDISLLGNINLTLQNKIELELDDLLLPYKFDVSIFYKIENRELIDHINRIGKTIYLSSNSPAANRR
jgi:predicted nucleotidyltransferase